MKDQEKWNLFNERIIEILKSNFYAIHVLFNTNRWVWGALKRNGHYVCDVPTESEILAVTKELIGDLRQMITENGFPENTTGVSTGRLNLEVDSDGWVDFSIDVHP